VLYAVQEPFHKALLAGKTTHAVWRSKPSFYAVSTEDRMINPDLERFIAKRMGAKTIEVRRAISRSSRSLRRLRDSFWKRPAESKSRRRNRSPGGRRRSRPTPSSAAGKLGGGSLFRLKNPQWSILRTILSQACIRVSTGGKTPRRSQNPTCAFRRCRRHQLGLT
jgi:hypothetical protein